MILGKFQDQFFVACIVQSVIKRRKYRNPQNFLGTVLRKTTSSGEHKNINILFNIIMTKYRISG